MQFQLPSNLQTELLAYDPTLKVLAKQAKKTTTKKSKYPLGNIPHLIPHNVVRESDQQAAIDHINQQLASDRYRVFTTPVDVATPQARLKVIAILYHYEQVWYAAWLPPKQEADQYIYGHAYAFRNTSAVAKTAPHFIWTSKDKCVAHQIGRGYETFTYMENITKEQIIINDNNLRSYHWKAPNLYCNAVFCNQKGYDINQNAVLKFEESLRENIPVWEDSRGIFDRIGCKNIFDAAGIPAPLKKHLDISQGLTVDNIINAADAFWRQTLYTSTTYPIVSSIKHIITTPAIRKLLQAELDKATENYNNPDNKRQDKIKQPFNTFVQICNSIHWIQMIWGDCPVDYYQTYIQELKCIRFDNIRTNSKLLVWICKHMPVASMFTMLRKHLEQQDLSRCVDSDVGYSRQNFFELNDTFSMIICILNAGKTLEPPKRWRITEFHDYVQAESWKIENAKEALHQDLFPEPIKVSVNNESWSFFQPIDTHQLAMWGQAVRNCVGSASHYANDIKKRKHFIVLCMIDGKPSFTIQLIVDHGLMSVKQIAGVANQRLTDKQKDQYSDAFKLALQQRENQLQSVG
jgi:hypothetical protein